MVWIQPAPQGPAGFFFCLSEKNNPASCHKAALGCDLLSGNIARVRSAGNGLLMRLDRAASQPGVGAGVTVVRRQKTACLELFAQQEKSKKSGKSDGGKND